MRSDTDINKTTQTFLIVEDQELLRKALADHFAASFEVIAIGTGEEAIQTIDKLPKIDLLITDFDLRGKLDGLDVARALRAKHPLTPIILLTGSDAELPRIKELLLIQKTLFVGKPFQKAALDQAIAAFFDEIHNFTTIKADELL